MPSLQAFLSLLDKETFQEQLLMWYALHKRSLPWRKTKDAYTIWLSEVILQQTKVMQGLAYYQKFLDKFPSIHALAQAEESEVLRLWQGLGYYSRARNLLKCAKTVVKDFNGTFPRSFKALLQLRGVGQYTAAAIASIAFQEPVPVLDGNVYRVLTRLFGIEEDISKRSGVKLLEALAEALLLKEDPGVYNQALMEFGALQCTPVPVCGTCIFRSTCYAFHRKKQHFLPHKTRKVKVKKRFLHYIFLQVGTDFYLNQRTGEDIWKGLYDFYLVEAENLYSFENLQGSLVQVLQEAGYGPLKQYPTYTHILTHQRLYVAFFHIQCDSNFIEKHKTMLAQTALQPFSLQAISALPKPILIHNFLEKEFHSHKLP